MDVWTTPVSDNLSIWFYSDTKSFPSTHHYKSKRFQFFFFSLYFDWMRRRICWFTVILCMISSINRIMDRYRRNWVAAFHNKRLDRDLIIRRYRVWRANNECFCVAWMSAEMPDDKWDSVIRRFVNQLFRSNRAHSTHFDHPPLRSPFVFYHSNSWRHCPRERAHVQV